MLVMTERRERLARAGEWLRDARKAKGLGQDDLGALIGTSGANVSNYERGHIEVPDDKAAKIAAALDLGELEVRRGLGLYVPSEEDTTGGDILDAIRRDTRLIPEARKHLEKQYKLLLRLSEPVDQDAQAAEGDILSLPNAARKRTPRKPRS